MGVNWGMMLTIFLAIVLARIVETALLSGRLGVSTQVGAEINSPAKATIIYANPIDGYIAEHYSSARR